MNTPPAHIHLKPNTIPYACHSLISVPHHWKTTIKNSIDTDTEKGIIVLPQLELLLNGQVQWFLKGTCTISWRNPPSSDNLPTFFSSSTKCQETVIDAADRYHTIPLHPDSQPRTTFFSEWDQFHYLQMSLDFIATGDVYTPRFDYIIADISRKARITDDILLYSNSTEQAFYDTLDFLTTCNNHSIVTNKNKFQFCQDTV